MRHRHESKREKHRAKLSLRLFLFCKREIWTERVLTDTVINQKLINHTVLRSNKQPESQVQAEIGERARVLLRYEFFFSLSKFKTK